MRANSERGSSNWDELMAELSGNDGRSQNYREQMLSELTHHIYSSICAKNLRDIMLEEGKENPDDSMLAALLHERQLLLDEYEGILSYERVIQRKCLDLYAPLLKAHNKRADKSSDALSMTNDPCPLPPEEHHRIFKQLESEMLKKSHPMELPMSLIVGGPPGVGVCSVIEDIWVGMREAGRSPVVIHEENYRECHSLRDTIMREHHLSFMPMTDSDVRTWTEALLNSAIMNGRDLIFTTTFSEQGPLLRRIKQLKDRAYNIDVMGIAMNGDVSRLNVIYLYELVKKMLWFAYRPSLEMHSKSYDNMPGTLRAIEMQGLIDRVRIIRR